MLLTYIFEWVPPEGAKGEEDYKRAVQYLNEVSTMLQLCKAKFRILQFIGGSYGS